FTKSYAHVKFIPGLSTTSLFSGPVRPSNRSKADGQSIQHFVGARRGISVCETSDLLLRALPRCRAAYCAASAKILMGGDIPRAGRERYKVVPRRGCRYFFPEGGSLKTGHPTSPPGSSHCRKSFLTKFPGMRPG